MRPDRLVVGECRGVELRELLAALNTGPRRRRGHAARQLARRRSGTPGGARRHRRPVARGGRAADGERVRPRAAPRAGRRAPPARRDRAVRAARRAARGGRAVIGSEPIGRGAASDVRAAGAAESAGSTAERGHPCRARGPSPATRYGRRGGCDRGGGRAPRGAPLRRGAGIRRMGARRRRANRRPRVARAGGSRVASGGAEAVHPPEGDPSDDDLVRAAAASAAAAGEPVAAAITAARATAPGSAAQWTVLATAWAVAASSGAPLAASLRELGAALRDEAQLRREVGSALAGPIASARLVLALPLIAIALRGAPRIRHVRGALRQPPRAGLPGRRRRPAVGGAALERLARGACDPLRGRRRPRTGAAGDRDVGRRLGRSGAATRPRCARGQRRGRRRRRVRPTT